MLIKGKTSLRSLVRMRSKRHVDGLDYLTAEIAFDSKAAHTLPVLLFTVSILNSHLPSQPEGADLTDHNQLGPGVSYPGPRAGQSDVQPAEEAV